MTDKFDELMYHAGLTADGSFNDMDKYDQEAVMKFAKLIVQECANIIADAVDHREPASTYVGKIKQHFGVE